MTRAAYKLSKEILGQEPGKLTVLFTLFALCSKPELEALSWSYTEELQEWQKRERNIITESPDEIIDKLGFSQYQEKKK